MNYVCDTLTIGLVLVLLFGSIALYLYTRIQQSEQKINLLESILLDLKMSNEIKSYTELPADEHVESYVSLDNLETISNNVSIKETTDIELNMNEDITYETFDESVQLIEEVDQVGQVDQVESEVEAKVNYESMSLKELQALAKSRGITGVTSKKSALIDALKAADTPVSGDLPGSLGTGLNSFIETSASFSNA